MAKENAQKARKKDAKPHGEMLFIKSGEPVYLPSSMEKNASMGGEEKAEMVAKQILAHYQKAFEELGK